MYHAAHLLGLQRQALIRNPALEFETTSKHQQPTGLDHTGEAQHISAALVYLQYHDLLRLFVHNQLLLLHGVAQTTVGESARCLV